MHAQVHHNMSVFSLLTTLANPSLSLYVPLLAWNWCHINQHHLIANMQRHHHLSLIIKCTSSSFTLSSHGHFYYYYYSILRSLTLLAPSPPGPPHGPPHPPRVLPLHLLVPPQCQHRPLQPPRSGRGAFVAFWEARRPWRQWRQGDRLWDILHVVPVLPRIRGPARPDILLESWEQQWWWWWWW